MHTPIVITPLNGKPITVTIATLAETHSYYSERPDQFLEVVQEIKDAIREKQPGWSVK